MIRVYLHCCKKTEPWLLMNADGTFNKRAIDEMRAHMIRVHKMSLDEINEKD